MIVMKTAHYKIEKGLPTKTRKEIQSFLSPNGRYAGFLRCVYLFKSGMYVKNQRILKLMQNHVLLVTPEGMKPWKDVPDYIPVPFCIPSGEEVILPSCFNHDSRLMHSASAIFCIKLQLLIKESGTLDSFILTEDAILDLSSHYVVVRSAAKKSKKKYSQRAFNGNLKKNLICRVKGRHNLYRLSKENEHIYKYLIKGTKPSQTAPVKRLATPPPPPDPIPTPQVRDGWLRKRSKSLLRGVLKLLAEIKQEEARL